MRNREYQKIILKNQAKAKLESKESSICSLNNEKPLKILLMGVITQWVRMNHLTRMYLKFSILESDILGFHSSFYLTYCLTLEIILKSYNSQGYAFYIKQILKFHWLIATKCISSCCPIWEPMVSSPQSLFLKSCGSTIPLNSQSFVFR